MQPASKPTKRPGELFKEQLTEANLKDLFSRAIDGRASAGRDGIRIHQFKSGLERELGVILRKVHNGTYEFTAYGEKLISKGAASKPRQISLPTIRDKLVLRFVFDLLLEVFEECKPPPTQQLIKKVKQESKASDEDDYYLRLDVEDFYGTINHSILMRKLRRRIRKKQILHLIENAIQTPTGTRKASGEKNRIGVPQGLSISNILASIYMIDADQRFSSVKETSYFRYVDDILVIGQKAKIDQLAVEIPKFLSSELKLHCHDIGQGEKSDKVPTANGISYLGYGFNQQNTEVKEKSYKRMFERLMKPFTQFKYNRNVEWLIWRLNLKISGCVIKERPIGWMFYFKETENLQQLGRLDAFVQQQAKKFLSSSDTKRIKSFYRAFHEIRYHPTSKYYIDFDNFDFEQRKDLLKKMLPPSQTQNLDEETVEAVDMMFERFLRRESSDLERDVFGHIS